MPAVKRDNKQARQHAQRKISTELIKGWNGPLKSKWI